MPRRRRSLKDHCCYHITHRCHEREFLFRFAGDREAYVKRLQEMNRRFKVDILNYVVTSNHIHLLVWVRKGDELSRAMQFVQGEFGQYYNSRKKREGAFWRDRFHSTLIQSGEHLSRCLFYIDMNMVRAGAVSHPRDWRHGGFHELAGLRKRYCIINQKRLLKCLENGHDPEAFREWYVRTLNQLVTSAYHVREPFWSNAFAVGDSEWLTGIYNEYGFQRKRIRKAEHVSDAVSDGSELYYIES